MIPYGQKTQNPLMKYRTTQPPDYQKTELEQVLMKKGVRNLIWNFF